MKSYYLIFLIFIEIGFSNGLFINEFLAINNNTISDENGGYGDWIEIYNSSSMSVNLGGMYLTDNLADPTHYQIPDGISIDPMGFLLFWADDDEEEGDLHTNFNISGSGEEIGLFDMDGITVIDSVSFISQTSDVSYGRETDGGNEWIFFTESTPGASNGGLNTMDNSELIPRQVSMFLYPNPFNPVTTISFSVPISANVKIAAYDIVGNQVATILNQTLPSGTQSVAWNAKNRPSGVYFVRMESGAFVRTQKVILLK